MHEAGIARAIIAALRTHEPQSDQIRVLVRGGHSIPEDFDAALRMHLRLTGTDVDLSGLEIVHLASVYTCATCGRQFEALGVAEPCPTCGGAAWPEPTPERIELEFLALAESAPG